MSSMHPNMTKPGILIAADDPKVLQSLSAITESQGYEVRYATDPQKALAFITEKSPDLILLDLRLSDGNGLHVCGRLKENGSTRDIPVIFLIEEIEEKVKVFGAGAADYITKPFLDEEVVKRIGMHLDLQHHHSFLEGRAGECSTRSADYSVQMQAEREQGNQAEKSLAERLQFESMLAEISARLINLHPDQVGPEIQEAQLLICEHLGIDRSAIWQFFPEEDTLRMSHIYQPPNSNPLAEPSHPGMRSTTDWVAQAPDPTPGFLGMHAEAYFPWLAKQVRSGRVALVSRLDDLPEEAAVDREFLLRYGTKSTAVVPLIAGGAVLGGISFASMREEREWPEPLVEQLKFIAQIFANILARARADRAVRASEERLNLAAVSANAGMWSLDTWSWSLWATAKARELFGTDPDEELTFEGILQYVHPEDRERIREMLLQGLQPGRDLAIEYRIVRPDGSVRWIASRGRIYRGSQGEPDRLMGVSVDITERKEMEEQLKARLQEIEGLKKQLEQENIYLREEVKLLSRHEDIVAKSDAMQRVLLQVEQVAPTSSTVLLTGETGTGKGMIARAIHRLSARKSLPLFVVNCASLPSTLIESELFGREKGAYTGAMSRMAGRFEAADGGTLFLDEIGDLPMEVQAKLLRILEEGRFERLGSTKTLQVNVRLLAATNRDLAQLVQEGKFRSDLYYRLNVFPIKIPPLRERPDDILPLVWAFVRQFQKEMGRQIQSISKRSLHALQHNPWPGNVRELRNVIEYAMIVSKGKTLEIGEGQEVQPAAPMTGDITSCVRNLKEMERQLILQVLQETKWRVSGKMGAAEILGLKPTTLESRMKKLGIHRSKP